MQSRRRISILPLLFLLLAGSTFAIAQSPSVATAVDHGDRPAADRTDDAARLPTEVLDFFGIAPGMRVLDLLAGGGYYTEILARVVSKEGSVIFHNNAAYLNFAGEAIPARTADGRLPNVEPITSEVNDLSFSEGELDAVVFVLGFHDIWFKDDGWTEIDPTKLLATLHRAMRPGAILGIVDHSAPAGAEPWDAGTRLHRIDEAHARKTIEAAGFTLAASSDILRNPDDDRSILVFDPTIRRKTDRFVLKFVRP